MHLMSRYAGVSIVLAILCTMLPVASSAQHHGSRDHQGMAGHASTSIVVGTTRVVLEVAGAEPGKVGQIVVRLTDRHDMTPISGAAVAVRVERMDDAKKGSTHQMETMGMEGETGGFPAVEREEKGVYRREHLFDKAAGTYQITAQVSAIGGRLLDAPLSVTVTQAVTKQGGRGMMGMMHPMPSGVWGIAAISAVMVGMMVLRVVLF